MIPSNITTVVRHNKEEPTEISIRTSSSYSVPCAACLIIRFDYEAAPSYYLVKSLTKYVFQVLLEYTPVHPSNTQSPTVPVRGEHPLLTSGYSYFFDRTAYVCPFTHPTNKPTRSPPHNQEWPTYLLHPTNQQTNHKFPPLGVAHVLDLPARPTNKQTNPVSGAIRQR